MKCRLVAVESRVSGGAKRGCSPESVAELGESRVSGGAKRGCSPESVAELGEIVVSSQWLS